MDEPADDLHEKYVLRGVASSANNRTSRTYFIRDESWWEATFANGPHASVTRVDLKDVQKVAGAMQEEVILVYVKADALAQTESFDLPETLKVSHQYWLSG